MKFCYKPVGRFVAMFTTVVACILIVKGPPFAIWPTQQLPALICVISCVPCLGALYVYSLATSLGLKESFMGKCTKGCLFGIFITSAVFFCLNLFWSDLTPPLHDLLLSDIANLHLPVCLMPETGVKCEASVSQLNQTKRQFPQNYNNVSDFDLGNSDTVLGCFLGGRIGPIECNARHRVAVIVPYRNRSDNLKGLLYHLHTLLPIQLLEYQIFVIEAIPNQTFNKAKLLNIGYLVASKLEDWDCYVFHDVDLSQPRALLTGISNDTGCFDCNPTGTVKYLYDHFFGGVVQLTKEHMKAVNGFSNNYWGWGGEDDDMGQRLINEGYTIDRYAKRGGVFRNQRTVIQGAETGNTKNPCASLMVARSTWLYSYKRDGLNTIEARIFYAKPKVSYTHVYVDLLERETRINNEDLCKSVRP